MSPRLARRWLRHHIPLAVLTGLAGGTLYVTRPYLDVISRLSFASAYPALALLALTLMVGPWRSLQGKSAALSLDLRRDIGIWAGIVGVFHAAIGQCVHLRGRPWLYYVYDGKVPHALPLRHDLFGAANFTGLVAALILLALLALSNDVSLRRLGGPQWKRWQRWNYACFGFTALHCLLYQVGIENQKVPFILAAIACIVTTVILQTAAYRRHI